MVTRPLAIQASASRREQIPVSLMYLFSRMGLRAAGGGSGLSEQRMVMTSFFVYSHSLFKVQKPLDRLRGLHVLLRFLKLS